MKLALIGGGGARTPLVYRALLERRTQLPFAEVVLHDLDPHRLERVEVVLAALAADHPDPVPYRCTTELADAVTDADFVFAAIRVGQLAGRSIDEAVPLRHGVLGQETTGPGGIAFALRTIPAMAAVADEIARRAPGAWLVNFTNPAGMITEALADRLDGRVIGICDSPNGLCERVAGALGRDAGAMTFDYFGLNHLGWLRRAWDGPTDMLPALLADDDALATFEEGQLFGAEWLRTLGMIPNEYLAYCYANDAIVASLRES